MEVRKLYYEDSLMRNFTATVQSCEETEKGFAVTLDATAFYPEGGGQACDLGALGGAKVLDVRESGEQYFEIIVDGNCPNDYLVDFNIRFTYENGLDDKDKTVYEDDGRQKAQFNVSKGYLLPATITEDTIYLSDKGRKDSP